MVGQLVNDELRDLEGSSGGLIKVLFRYFPGRILKNHKELQSGSLIAASYDNKQNLFHRTINTTSLCPFYCFVVFRG
jgi:hypothetical protein